MILKALKDSQISKFDRSYNKLVLLSNKQLKKKILSHESKKIVNKEAFIYLSAN